HLDYASLNGGEPSVVARDAAVAGWAGVLGGFAGTQHLLGVPRVSLDGDQARLEASFVATHHLPDSLGSSLWTLGGIYTVELARAHARWRITSLTMTATWGAGNQHLNAKAAQRAATGT
ncbi:MAG: nuclear transport factor 2 family protein, partial [Dehalococcoidia bacterium]